MPSSTATKPIALGATPLGLAEWDVDDPAQQHLLLCGVGPDLHMTLLDAVRTELAETAVGPTCFGDLLTPDLTGLAIDRHRRQGRVAVVVLDPRTYSDEPSEVQHRDRREASRLMSELASLPGAHIVRVTSQRDALQHMPVAFTVNSARVLLGDTASWKHLLRQPSPGVMHPFEGLIDLPGQPVRPIRL